MKHLKTPQELNEALDKSDFMGSILTKLQSRLKELEDEKTWDEWDDGVNFGRKDMIEEVMKMVENSRGEINRQGSLIDRGL
jgi:hypothetical protein